MFAKFLKSHFIPLFLATLILCFLLNLPTNLAQESKQQNPLELEQAEQYYEKGEVGKAIRTWDALILTYRNKNDPQSRRLIAELLIDQAQAYIKLGQAQKATALVTEALTLAKEIQAWGITALAQGVLGNAQLLSGDFKGAITSYSVSLELARTQNQPHLIVALLNNLTNAYNRLTQKYEQEAQWALQEKEEQEAQRLTDLARQQQLAAKDYANRAVETSRATEGASTVRALLNFIPFTTESERIAYTQQALSILEKLPNSRNKAFLFINLAEAEGEKPHQVISLKKAIQTAQAMGDNRALSFALLELGRISEKLGNYEQALSLTQQAQQAAQQSFAIDSLYRASWQLARIHRATGQDFEAKDAYRRAISSLQSIRRELAAASNDFQLDFRDEIEPLYREFLELLLKEESPSQIQEALNIIELFQLAELENFFGDDCIEGQKNKIQEILAKTKTALIHSVILEDNTYLILQLPNGSIRRYQVAIPAQEINQKLKQWRELLEDGTTNKYLVLSQSLYDLLFRPLEAELSQSSPNNLIFIHDELLRNVPMAALYDSQEKKYLIEKYPIAMSLGLNLGTRIKPEPSGGKEALTFGLTVSISPFEALPNVNQETQEITTILGGERFLDAQFTRETFRNNLENNQLSIIHLATHGKFRGMPENSFIQAFDQPIYLKDLEAILTQSKASIELLTLSACQTAAGNERAFLGLAGLAIRSGVKSTLGSLWSINDEATVSLMTDFYQNLKQGMTQVEALQKAQLIQIANPESHPTNWSNFVLTMRVS